MSIKNYLEENYSEDVTDMIGHIYHCYIDPEFFGYTIEEGGIEYEKDLQVDDEEEDVNVIFVQILKHIKDQWHNSYHNFDYVNFLNWDLTNPNDYAEFVQDEEAVDTLLCAIIDMVWYSLYYEDKYEPREELTCYQLLVEYIEEHA